MILISEGYKNGFYWQFSYIFVCLFIYMYRIYYKDCDIKIFFIIYLKESLKIKIDLDNISVF